jgi:hypothetical protein
MNSEEKYIAVYGRDGTHISNIQLSKWNITRKVFDLDVSNFEGSCDDDITTGLLFVMNDKYGNKEYSGFMKSIIQDKETGHVTFKGEDLRSIWDTEVLLDFTDLDPAGYNDFEIWQIFTKVSDAVEESATTIFELNFTIGVDQQLTNSLGDYTGSYFYVNALKFLKTYLSYYGYYITSDFDESDASIDFTFVKNTTTRSVRLEDFIFDRTLTEVKTNHTVARIKFDTLIEGEREFRELTSTTVSDQFDAQPSDNKETITGSYINSLDINDYPDGFWIKTVNLSDAYYITRTIEKNWQFVVQQYWDNQPTRNRGTDLDSTDNQLPSVDPNDYPVGFAMKLVVGAVTNYWKCILNTSVLPSTVEEKEYYLGLDNEIYEETISSSNQIYPVITKYFEDEYLAKAQFNAIWELVNSRYNENVILDKVNAPVDITVYNLFDMITVYDSNGDSKELPVSEIRWTQDSYKIKLGFKKERFTDIVKEATGTKSSGAIQMKNPFKLIRDLGRLGNLSDTK